MKADIEAAAEAVELPMDKLTSTTQQVKKIVVHKAVHGSPIFSRLTVYILVLFFANIGLH